ncbi:MULTISPECIES: PTS system mannose/fructose/sorbose family transporter subunit IID [Myxococcus]|uniref:PTS system mannose/fructose/sorbose family transporter subunit IID n=1 Tax=Myxococcus TaxID=32 RepID=UPI00112632D2|nr:MULTISPECIES: PTS system mannose/fructose/sorbose family transporter subunit IID [Myxococcus]WAM25588.1 PTS system mannose/fructose/sorbose family transporter subunit IID [Myxococcus sp. NMCA1]
MSTTPQATLPFGVLLRVFLRSLFLQASWNPKGMQNLGLAYAVYPALAALYPQGPAREEAVRRHLVFFNTHPYVAAAIVGGVINHEERIARGEETPDKVVAFKAALMGPLAALGDGFFWLSLKPATGAVSAALVPLLGVWAVPLFLVLYNLVHLLLRVRLYWLGLTLGDRLVEAVARANLPARGARLRAVAAASAGGVAAWLAVSFGANAGGLYAPLLAAGCLALGVASYVLVSRRVPNYVVLYVAAGLACVAGAFL